MNNISQRVLDCLKDLLGRAVHPSDRIQEDLRADSIDLVEIVMALENEFGIEISSNTFQEWNTVQDVITYFENN